MCFKNKTMNNTLQIGSSGQLVIQLQMFLNIQGFFIDMDGMFGLLTKSAVSSYQGKQGLPITGIADESLIALSSAQGGLDKWCLSIKSMEGYIEPCESYPRGTPAWRNNNPGNIKFGTFARSHGAYKSDISGFAVFHDYQTGYNALKILLINACTGQSFIYKPDMTLYEFYQKYAPTADSNNPMGYATKVAKDLGVTVDTPIRELLTTF